MVDVYLNGDLLLEDIAFRTATAFVDAPAGININIGVAPSNSTDVTDTIANFPLKLDAKEKYIAVAAGITGLSSTTYSVTPAFGLDIFAMARETATVATNTDVLVYHGSTDAPTVDVFESLVPAGTIVDDVSYGGAGYLELATNNYVLNVQNAAGTVTVASYSAPLSTLNLDGSAITVLASGFLDSTANGNGPAFGLYVALAAGGELIPLPKNITTSISDVENSTFKVYPNPVVDVLTIENDNLVSGTIVNQAGKVVKRFTQSNVNLSELASGIYFVNILTDENVITKKIVKK